MKALALALLLAGMAAAQFDETDAKLDSCRRDCCSRMGGEWDAGLAECAVDSAGYNDYYRCRNECLEIASRDYGAMGGGGLACCAPASVLLALALAAARK